MQKETLFVWCEKIRDNRSLTYNYLGHRSVGHPNLKTILHVLRQIFRPVRNLKASSGNDLSRHAVFSVSLHIAPSSTGSPSTTLNLSAFNTRNVGSNSSIFPITASIGLSRNPQMSNYPPYILPLNLFTQRFSGRTRFSAGNSSSSASSNAPSGLSFAPSTSFASISESSTALASSPKSEPLKS